MKLQMDGIWKQPDSGKQYQICNRCVMDTTDPDITFDSQGICVHCRRAENCLKSSPASLPINERKELFDQLIRKIKDEGKHKKYDCIIGMSGGVDSTYTAYMVRRLGLRPLAVHLDNGWDAELAVRNIEYTLKYLGIDFYTHVLDWDEFKNLQLAFLKASTPDSEIPTDHAIGTVLYQMAHREKTRYIIGGTNIATESILPRAWSQGHGDWKYIREANKKFGVCPLKSFPHRNLLTHLFYRYVSGIRWVSLLDYFDYSKADAIKVLEREIGWKDYGSKHFESVYTRFYQAYILPVKFGYDKRRAHFSSMIVSGQMDRESALNELKKPTYDPTLLREDKEYVMNKFEITDGEFERIMQLPKRRFEQFKSYHSAWYYKFLGSIRNLTKRSS